MEKRFHYLHVQDAVKHLPKTIRMLRGNSTDNKHQRALLGLLPPLTPGPWQQTAHSLHFLRISNIAITPFLRTERKCHVVAERGGIWI